jgi:hypothetical protein
LFAGGATATSTSQDVSKGDVDHSARRRGVHSSTGGGLGSRGRSTVARSTAGTSTGRSASCVNLALKGTGTIDGVKGAVVTLFAGVDDAITASWLDTCGSAAVGEIRVVLALITLLSSFNDTVATHRASVLSPGDGTAVEGLSSTGVGGIKHGSEGRQLLGRERLGFGEDVPGGSLSARRSGNRALVGYNRGANLIKDISEAKGRTGAGAAGVGQASSGAAGRIEVVIGAGGGGTLVTKLTIQVIDDVITTEREDAIAAAAVGLVTVEGTIVALLAIISDSVSASGIGTTEIRSTNRVTVRSAGVGKEGVEGSIITLLGTITATITALNHSGGGAAVTVDEIAIIALFPRIDDAITLTRKHTSGTAGSSSDVGIGSTKITLFQGITNTITAGRQHTIGAAGVGGGVGISRTHVTLLGGLNNTVSTENLTGRAAVNGSIRAGKTV